MISYPMNPKTTGAPSNLQIREFENELAHHFREINNEWIESMFGIEPVDERVLADPRANILEMGGCILFVETEQQGIVGSGALLPSVYGLELTKMGVRSEARGLKAGEFLLAALIERGRAMKIEPFFLLTNKACGAAIHLYEKLGFVHDADLLSRYGQHYDRCNVAMRLPLAE